MQIFQDDDERVCHSLLHQQVAHRFVNGLVFVLRVAMCDAPFLNGSSQEHRQRSSMHTREVVPVEGISERILKDCRRQPIGEFKQLLTEHAEGVVE
jgi:hypothetical protein